MIDLHTHILPGVDDGARDLDVALAMAKIFVQQGVTCVACTPHILPGLYPNTGREIRRSVEALRVELERMGLALDLVVGADNHIAADFLAGLRSGHLLPLANSRYVLVEPPHHVPPPRLENAFFELLLAGYVPILTHPERLSWIETNYDRMKALVAKGVWMQVTSGSLRGSFGRRPRYWAERMVCDGLINIMASDAHNVTLRRPDLLEGFEIAARLVGNDEAHHMVRTRPQGIVQNCGPGDLPGTPARMLMADGEGCDNGSPDLDSSRLGVFDRVRRLFT